MLTLRKALRELLIFGRIWEMEKEELKELRELRELENYIVHRPLSIVRDHSPCSRTSRAISALGWP